MHTPPKLLVIAIDRLPAWMLPPYGATWVAMPTLTRLASRGVVFDRLVATEADPGHTLQQLLAPLAGIRAAVVADDRPPEGGTAPAAAIGDTRLARLFAAAAETLATTDSHLVVVQAASLGHAWDAPAEFREQYVDPADPPLPAGIAMPDFVASTATDPDLLVGLRHVFAGQLTLLDRCLGALGDLAGWSVVVCGVRGLGLGLHGRMGPGAMPPYGELVHLPAIVVDAAGRMAGQRFAGLMTPADLGALLGELIAAPAPREHDTMDMDDDGGSTTGPAIARLFVRWPLRGRDRVVVMTPEGSAVVTPGWHAVATPDGPLRLFAKPDDFFEVNDVADRCPDVAAELGSLVAAAARGDGETAWREPLSPTAADGIA